MMQMGIYFQQARIFNIIMSERPWDVLRSGRTELAIQMLQNAFFEKQTSALLIELGVAYLWMKDYQAAFDHLSGQMKIIPRRIEKIFGLAGVAKWCLNKPDEAIEQWVDGLKCDYADGAGGVTIPLLLYSASILKPELYSRKNAEKYLIARAKHRKIRNWPGPIAEYILNRIDKSQLLSDLKAYNEINTLINSWRVDFYFGILDYASGNTEKSTQFIRNATNLSFDDFDSNRHLFLSKIWHEEFYIARHQTQSICNHP
jgi:tetratricopeptide (TPR) repeat protein